MTGDALRTWQRLWDDLGVSHYAEVGSLALSTVEGDWADLARQTLDHLGLDYEVLDGKQLEALCPFMRAPDGAWGLYNTTGGLLFASRIVDSLIRDLRRSEEHPSELQSLMRISYAVFCLKKKKSHSQPQHDQDTQLTNVR